MLSTFQSAAPIMAVEIENDCNAQHTDSQWSLPLLGSAPIPRRPPQPPALLGAAWLMPLADRPSQAAIELLRVGLAPLLWIKLSRHL